ncbi:MIND complex subunit MTW1 KNAG_0D04960 [Huiozyma naganishii CBS 8797]|uniref:Mis12 domain-containing protein n=1 Tax=Huiozyma naganishii (strain ATCC MYA-139 / BCRC 22969 / CBS 8797 / KCTC 17520 / NBRC 10181 / NCYC 3082 / Yp74L-3) TaxID=1071383 RepID=J7R5U9_HUIN7|nr:hypothetical protein KNAG_0D04960 [Kazachstania naganishii CBS 8797]CCK70235.1 hypothetical protein KNAG_0D04960 [Kazachstania naganishii CBS 8797]
MSAPGLQATALMTQHLEFPPVSLLDEIINMVNDIMFKCTEAMENYLLKSPVVNGTDFSGEIKVGVARLETLLEHSVDKNFDRLELYTLRNVFNIPQELIEHDVFRLAHQRDLLVADAPACARSCDELGEKVVQVEREFHRNAQLRERLEKMRIVSSDVKRFKTRVLALCELQGNTQGDLAAVYESIAPIDDTMLLLRTQLKQLYEDNERICSMGKLSSILHSGEQRVSRSQYISQEVHKILQDES